MTNWPQTVKRVVKQTEARMKKMIIVLTLINVAICGLSFWCLYMTASLSKEALRLARNRVIESHSNQGAPHEHQGLDSGPKYREYGDLS